MSFDVGLAIGSLPRIVLGAGITLELFVWSILFGLLLGTTAVLMRLSGRWYLIWPAYLYVYLFRGTPILVQIFVIYYGLPQFDFVRDSVFWPILREPFWCLIIALSLNDGAYTAEILRGGILGVNRGLYEAAWVLGLSRRQRFQHIVVPIATRLALPPYGNEMISMLKATALASTVTLLDITGVARTIVAQTFAPYEIFVSAALVYLFLAWVIQRGIGLYENRVGRYVKT